VAHTVPEGWVFGASALVDTHALSAARNPSRAFPVAARTSRGSWAGPAKPARATGQGTLAIGVLRA